MARAKRNSSVVTVRMPEDSGPQVCIAGTTLDLDEDNCVDCSPEQARHLIESHGGVEYRDPEEIAAETAKRVRTRTGAQTGTQSGETDGQKTGEKAGTDGK